MQQKYGIQLFSVRDSLENDFEGTLKKISEMGYSYVEFAGFYGHSAEEVAEILDKYRLVATGTHTNWTELKPAEIDKTIKFHKTIGVRDLIVPMADMRTPDRVDRFVSIANFAQPILEGEGICMSYHNHSHELVTMPWGTTLLSELWHRTKLNFEIDTFWAWNAGTDPLQVLDRFSDRVHTIHLKDGFKGGKGIPLGEGEAPVKAVRERAIFRNLTMIVESETLTPSGLDEAQRCIDFLAGLE